LDLGLVASSCHGHVWFSTTTSIDDWSQFFDQITCVDVFVLACYEKIDLVTDCCDQNKDVRVIFLFPVIRKGTKGTCI
jgi:hypothetical protein